MNTRVAIEKNTEEIDEWIVAWGLSDEREDVTFAVRCGRYSGTYARFNDENDDRTDFVIEEYGEPDLRKMNYQNFRMALKALIKGRKKTTADEFCISYMQDAWNAFCKAHPQVDAGLFNWGNVSFNR